MKLAHPTEHTTDGVPGHTPSQGEPENGWCILRSNRLLQTLSRKEAKRLLDNAQWLRFTPEKVVVQQGRPVDAVFFVIHGKAAAVIEVPLPGSQDFGAIVHFLGPGADIGLLSLVDGAPHLATVTALGDLEVVAVPVDALQQCLRSRPSRYRVLAQVAVESLRTYQRAFRQGWERVEGRQIIC
ncbi:MAG: cyclic nucleotide-binding domain-containing protein [Dehalococcoidia bacterium]